MVAVVAVVGVQSALLGGRMERRHFLITGAVLASMPSTLLAQTRGRYVGNLLLSPVRGRLMRTGADFGYIDARGNRWDVPSGALVDGASIPRIFWTLIGSPWSGEYAQASVVHDWFCAVRIRPWKETHRVFYDAMITSGVSRAQAKVMYLAVRFAGPSWDDLTLENSRILTDDGKRRLTAAGTKSYELGFASQEEETQAREALLEKFDAMSETVRGDDLSLDKIDDLVDEVGRAEIVAQMIE